MTANVAGQEWMGFSKRKKVAEEILRRQEVDIIGFQELGVDNWDEVFKKAQPDLTIAHGKVVGDIIINSFAFRTERFELIDLHTLWLSPNGTYMKGWDGVERGLTLGQLKDRENGRTFIFMNTHLDNKGIQARIESIKIILKLSRTCGEMPVILTADSNVSVDSPRSDIWSKLIYRRPYTMLLCEKFIDTWKATHSAKRPCSFHHFMGPQYNPCKDDEYGTCDTEWIMVRGFRPLSCNLVTDFIKHTYPSDHYWMKAEVAYDK